MEQLGQEAFQDVEVGFVSEQPHLPGGCPELLPAKPDRCPPKPLSINILYLSRRAYLPRPKRDLPGGCPKHLPAKLAHCPPKPAENQYFNLSRRAFCQARSAVFRADALSKINIYIRRRARLPLLVVANYCLPDH